VLLLLLGALAVLVRIAWRRLSARRGGAPLSQWIFRNASTGRLGGAAQVAFYRRLERLLARRRLRRRAGQTQREFAREAAAHLNRPQAELASVLNNLVEAFYRVRFGKRPLDSAEVQAIETTMNQLEATFAKKHA
jgi:hypothetical protein